MTVKQFVVEILDSDGFDSAHEVEAGSWHTAYDKAMEQHYNAIGYRSWQDRKAPCPIIIRFMVKRIDEGEE